jgi:dipeptidyl aminopeptidase/acylaminoacyl peptidase
LRQRARQPIRHWVTDRRGQVRLGFGLEGTTRSYYARLDGDRDWRRLTKFEVFSREIHFRPIAISADDPNKAYAIAPSEGRNAVWIMDLTDKDDPTLLFAHPLVDVTDPVLASDGRLLGVHYETDYPMMYFADAHTRGVIDAIKTLLPGDFSVVKDATRDENVYVIRSVSDIDAPSYRVFDLTTRVVASLGAPYPDLDAAALATMRPITYPARDGTQIPGYLSVPRGGPTAHLPLIVMPHGGPIARDTWRYFFLRQFLVSRGYAVLQMNFRGSSGYGNDWFFAAHQDWGGLTYDDVVDGARWAMQQGIADPGRVCIVGWSFGGYLALVGAQRNPDLFRCAVSIAGLSDLGLLVDEGHRWLNPAVVQKQIGTDPAKLKRDSPRLHAAEFRVPVLMLHGDRDAQAPYAQSEVMDTALTRAGKPHRFVTIHDADHQLSSESDRITMLREVEMFLAEHLGADASRAP